MTESSQITVITPLESLGVPDTMTSREIAELTGKEHRNVIRDIRAMLLEVQEDVLKFEHIFSDSMNREQTEYVLDQELTFTLLTGYRADLRRKVVARWMELEAAHKALALGSMREQVLLELDEDSPLRQKRVHAPEYDIGRSLVKEAGKHASALSKLSASGLLSAGLKECIRCALLQASRLRERFEADDERMSRDEVARAKLEMLREQEARDSKRWVREGFKALAGAR